MLSGMMAVAVGIGLSTRLPELPPAPLLPALLPVALLLIGSRAPPWRWLGCVALGVAWGCWRGQGMLAHALPAQLEGVDLRAHVCIEGLPQRRREFGRESWLIQARLLEPIPIGGERDRRWHGRRLQLSSYAPQSFRPGERWDLALRLRVPRGFANPGGRDHQAWLLARGIDATGYVVWKGSAPPRATGACAAAVHRLRHRLRERLVALGNGHPRVSSLVALSLGDGSLLEPEDWTVLARTGTTHLLVISGMHISLIALMLWRIAAVGARASPWALRRWPASAWGGVAALPGALAYTALAGFAVPAERALIMLAAVIVFTLLRRQVAPWMAFVAALLAIVAEQPLVVMQSGFWLSFIAVAALMVAFAGRLRAPGPVEMAWKPQLVVLAAVFCPLLLAGQPGVPLAPLVNALAIPLVNLVSVPFALLGCLALPLGSAVSGVLVTISLWSLELLWIGLERAAEWSPVLQSRAGDPSWWTWLPACAGVLWMLAPAGFPARALGALLLLPLAFPAARGHDPLELLMLDVGQGAAVVLRTRRHALVYDAGPRFSDRFDAGAHIVAPALRHLGVREIDMLLVSHGDGDHAGGIAGLLDVVSARAAMAGEPIAGHPMPLCRRGMRWTWDGVRFEILHPATPAPAASGNDRSCVLRVEYAGRVLLLSGDIEARAEASLLAADPARLRADVLLVPHHGSRSSSTGPFVAAVRPRFALVSAGYRNRFGHPHPLVVQRYRTAGARIIETARAGAVWLRVRANGEIEEPVLWRRVARRYWFARG